MVFVPEAREILAGGATKMPLSGEPGWLVAKAGINLVTKDNIKGMFS